MRLTHVLSLAFMLCLPGATQPFGFAQDKQKDLTEYSKLAQSKDHNERINAIELIQGLENLQSTQLIAAHLVDEHPKVRLRAVKALAKVSDPQAVEFLAKTALRHSNRWVRMGTAEALGRLKDPKTLPALCDALKDSDPEVRAAAAGAVENVHDASRFDEMLATFQRESVWYPKALMLESLATLDPVKAVDHVRKALEDRNAPVRMVAVEQLAKIHPESAIKAMPDVLNDPDWRVRVCAVEACEELRQAEVIGPLINRLAQEKGRVRVDILMTLKELTGKDFALDLRTWKAWWEANKQEFRIPGKKSDRAKGKKSRSTAKDMPTGTTEFEFFKVPIYSTRAAFVLDLSGSMRDEAASKDKKKDEEDLTKLEVAKKEMTATIQSFTPDVWFNIILLGSDRDGDYDRKQKVWKTGLVPAVPESKAAAAAFTNKQQARGWTNIYDALLLAMEDPNVDTIFLLSDGGASAGIFVAGEEILSELDRINRFRKIMIYAIEIESDTKHKLMKDLAEFSGGFHIQK